MGGPPLHSCRCAARAVRAVRVAALGGPAAPHGSPAAGGEIPRKSPPARAVFEQEFLALEKNYYLYSYN